MGEYPNRRPAQRHVAPDGGRQRWQADTGVDRQRRAYPPRRRPAVRGRLGRLQHLDAPKPGRRALLKRPRVPRRRRCAPAVANRRYGHEHRYRRRGRSRLETRSGRTRMGRLETAGELFRGATADRHASHQSHVRLPYLPRQVPRRLRRDRGRHPRRPCPSRRGRSRAGPGGGTDVPNNRITARISI